MTKDIEGSQDKKLCLHVELNVVPTMLCFVDPSLVQK